MMKQPACTSVATEVDNDIHLALSCAVSLASWDSGELTIGRHCWHFVGDHVMTSRVTGHMP